MTPKSNESHSFFASCLPGLEPILLAEMEEYDIGMQRTEVPGGVEFEGPLATMVRANRELGTAQQIRVRLAHLHVTKLAELDRKARAIPFEKWLRADMPLRVRVSAKKSRLYHTGAIAERIERGIAHRLGSAPDKGDGQRVFIRVFQNKMDVSFDTSGAPLHRRGYRLAGGKAPIREDLACALIRVSGWDRRSRFVDPMMGSGTLAIEAALLASGLPPGGRRSFAFADAPCVREAKDGQTFEDAFSSTAASTTLPVIFGSDRNEKIITSARENAERAGVESYIQFAHAALKDAPGLGTNVEHGALVTNPPYGARIQSRDLRPLLQTLGTLIKERPAWQFGCVFPEADLARRMGTPLTSALMTDHGGTKVRFFRR